MVGEGTNVWPGVATAPDSRWIEIPVPRRSGDSWLHVDGVAVSDDGRTVVQFGGTVLVRLP